MHGVTDNGWVPRPCRVSHQGGRPIDWGPPPTPLTGPPEKVVAAGLRTAAHTGRCSGNTKEMNY